MAEQVTGVCVLMAQDVDALAALVELADDDGLLDAIPDTLADSFRAAAKRARAALTKRLAVMDGLNDRLVKGEPCVVRLQDAGR